MWHCPKGTGRVTRWNWETQGWIRKDPWQLPCKSVRFKKGLSVNLKDDSLEITFL